MPGNEETIKTKCNREEELKRINGRIDRLRKIIEDYLFLANEMQLGSLRASLKNV